MGEIVHESPGSPVAPAAADPSSWLDAHGDALFSYAMARLGSREDAEDAVQEALLAAVRGAGDFRGRSAVRTWLIGILRHKIHDSLRRRARESAWRDALQAELAGAPCGFTAKGLRREPASEWPPVPPRALEQQELLDVLERAIRTLPDAMRQVFYLTQIDGIGTDEVCGLLEITRQNLWTLVHRARLRLRAELDKSWFSVNTQPGRRR